MTRVAKGQLPDTSFREARPHFSDAELVDLTLAVVAINGWNRLLIAMRAPAGTYRPGQWRQLHASPDAAQDASH
jgi:hypothetical protein